MFVHRGGSEGGHLIWLDICEDWVGEQFWWSGLLARLGYLYVWYGSKIWMHGQVGSLAGLFDWMERLGGQGRRSGR